MNNNDDVEENEVEEDSGLSPETMLLYVGMFTGISSVALLGLLIFRRSEREDFEHGQNEVE